MLLNRLDLLVLTVQFLTNGGVTPITTAKNAANPSTHGAVASFRKFLQPQFLQLELTIILRWAPETRQPATQVFPVR